MHIILASASPRRKKLLSSLNIKFTVHPSHVSEKIKENLEPASYVSLLAERKAADICKHYQAENALIIAADTIVRLGNEIIGKPANLNQAKDILQHLSGNTHEVWTGVHTIHTKKMQGFSFSERTFVTFGTLDEQLLNHYLAIGSPLDKAGAYGIQDDWGALFVKKIDGDYNNVVGFPLYGFYRHINRYHPELANTLFFNSRFSA